MTWLVNRNMRVAATYDFTDQTWQHVANGADRGQFHAEHWAADFAAGHVIAGGFIACSFY